MILTIEELYCLHTMNKKTGAIPGIPDLYADKSKAEIRALFKQGQDSLVKRGLGKDDEFSSLITAHGALLEIYVDQTDFITLDNTVFETSNNQILAITFIETDGVYDFGIQYKGLLFTKIMNNYKSLLSPYTTSAKSVEFTEKVHKQLEYAQFAQTYGDIKEAIFIKRVESRNTIFSRIIFAHGFSEQQYDFLTSEIKEVRRNVMAHQLYRWMNIAELEYSREEIEAFAERLQRGEKI